MLVFLYNGSFEGLLTAVFEAYYGGERPDSILCGREAEENLLDTFRQIPVDQGKADRVARAVRTKISEDAYVTAFHASLCRDADRGTLIYRYLRLGFMLGRAVDSHLQEGCVFAVQDMERRVVREAHRLTGLLRFRLVRQELYYAPYCPDHNITALLAPHFAQRLADRDWIIHDTRRDTAAVYNRREWVILQGLPAIPVLPDLQEDYPALWRQYFKSIAIAERANPRCQKNFMPVRYWNNLTEVNGGK
jgi:probable DNA metabolism protein